MNNFIRFLSIPLTITLFLSSWNCSRQPKIQKPFPPPSQAKQVSTQSQPEEKPSSQDEKNAQPSSQLSPQTKTINQEKVNPSALLEDALDSYQDAQSAWERGDFETALTTLDEAYSLILKAELPQDSPLIQEKNDLRLLIAKRIQEIYASRLITVGDNNMTIPLVENNYVKAEIKNFQTKEKKYLEESYRRSGLYRKIIVEELIKAGLPEQLSWVPIIESGFKVRAFSRARALGLWQFISSTGYRFGLKRDRWIDERMDPLKSTRAAIKYLTELHSFFGDWTTALAAYNCGEFRVQNVIRNQRLNYLDNFWDLFAMLPRETARFVPRLIAALLIINNPEKYGFDLPPPDPPLRYETITVNHPFRLSSLSKNLGLEEKALSIFNSDLRHDGTPEYEYSLKVPAGMRQRALEIANSLPRWIPPEATYIVHYVRRGETLSGIAQRYRTSVSAIARLNRLRRVHLIRPGQRLKVPAKSGRYRTSATLRTEKIGEKITYTVKRGDSLYVLAHAFSTTVQRIKKLNNLKSNVLHVGQRLVIHSGKPEGAIIYVVRSGDTPFQIAKKFNMNLQNLLHLNSLSRRSRIYPGQELWIIPKK